MFGIPDVIFYTYCMDFVIVAILIAYWYFGIHIKGNVFILKNYKGMYLLVKHLRISKDTEKVEINHKKEKKTFMVKPSFFSGDRPNAFIDYDTGDIITFTGISVNLSPNELDIFVGGKILPQLIRGLLTEHLNLVLLIIGCIASFVVGLYISPYIPSPNAPTPTQPVIGG